MNWTCIGLFLLSGMALSASATERSPATIRMVLAGDSTVAVASGWGGGFAERFDASVEVINVARGGRSSKSFRDEGHWQCVLDARPTHVLIQFGHNDQPGKGPTRETDFATTFRDNLSRYVADVRSSGATPILCTSIERRRYDERGKVRASLSDYAEATRAVAAREGVPLLDLHARTIAIYESMGEAEWIAVSPTGKDGKVDTTHLNEVSGRIVGDIVVEELVKVMPDVAQHVVPRATTRPSD